jgi:glycyl-tRNA synthetase beta chain
MWEPMATLLVEIGCEELPAAACREALGQLPELCRRALGVEPSRVLVTPRRLALLAEDVPERTPDEWVKGPPVKVAEQAAAGFAKRHGVAVDELDERDGFLGVEVAGQPLAEVLPDRVDAILRGLSFSKTMRWDDSGLRFPRPVRWRLAMVDADRIVGEGSYGHRFTSGPLDVPEASAYVDVLRGADVEPDVDERRRQIVEALDALSGWSDPNGVLEEVVFLVEHPIVIEGRFDKRYLQLPSRVVETTIQKHVRAFPLGENRFAFVANGGDPGIVRAGVENVVEGRLEDASFTFERDLSVGLDSLAEQLGSITFFAEAGTYADKTARLVKLAEALGGGEAALEAARLAKADQASELVREFPELEGHVGAEYARLAGYPEAVCAAIDEQYLPDAADAPLPQTETGRVLSAADKIDTLNVSFGLGQRPSGSRDPYGLRRAAIGLCRLATEGNLTIERGLMEGEVGEFGARPRRRRTPCASACCPARRALHADSHRLCARESSRREGRGRRRRAQPRSAHRPRGGRRRRGARARRSQDRSRARLGRFRHGSRSGGRARTASGHVLRGRACDGRGPSRPLQPAAPAPQCTRHPRAPRRALADPPSLDGLPSHQLIEAPKRGINLYVEKAGVVPMRRCGNRLAASASLWERPAAAVPARRSSSA